MRFAYSGTTDAQLNSRDGCKCQIVRALTQAEADLEETGPMYRVRFSMDGFEADVFEDELHGAKIYARAQSGGAA